jgi:hypothetical protein
MSNCPTNSTSTVFCKKHSKCRSHTSTTIARSLSKKAKWDSISYNISSLKDTQATSSGPMSIRNWIAITPMNMTTIRFILPRVRINGDRPEGRIKFVNTGWKIPLSILIDLTTPAADWKATIQTRLIDPLPEDGPGSMKIYPPGMFSKDQWKAPTGLPTSNPWNGSVEIWKGLRGRIKTILITLEISWLEAPFIETTSPVLQSMTRTAITISQSTKNTLIIRTLTQHTFIAGRKISIAVEMPHHSHQSTKIMQTLH